MTLKAILEDMQANQSPSVLKRYEKAGENQPYIGLMMGTINKLAKKYAQSPDLALPLWQTGILDAQLLAIQLFKPQELTKEEAIQLLDDRLSLQVLDKLADRVLAKTVYANQLKEDLFETDSLVLQRLGWRLQTAAVAQKNLTSSEIEELIAQIERELKASPEILKWVMNQCLVEVAVRYDDYRQAIIGMTEELAVYKDMKVAKGCTSAYAPDWIAARVKK